MGCILKLCESIVLLLPKVMLYYIIGLGGRVNVSRDEGLSATTLTPAASPP